MGAIEDSNKANEEVTSSTDVEISNSPDTSAPTDDSPQQGDSVQVELAKTNPVDLNKLPLSFNDVRIHFRSLVPAKLKLRSPVKRFYRSKGFAKKEHPVLQFYQYLYDTPFNPQDEFHCKLMQSVYMLLTRSSTVPEISGDHWKTSHCSSSSSSPQDSLACEGFYHIFFPQLLPAPHKSLLSLYLGLYLLNGITNQDVQLVMTTLLQNMFKRSYSTELPHDNVMDAPFVDPVRWKGLLTHESIEHAEQCTIVQHNKLPSRITSQQYPASTVKEFANPQDRKAVNYFEFFNALSLALGTFIFKNNRFKFYQQFFALNLPDPMPHIEPVLEAILLKAISVTAITSLQYYYTHYVTNSDLPAMALYFTERIHYDPMSYIRWLDPSNANKPGNELCEGGFRAFYQNNLTRYAYYNQPLLPSFVFTKIKMHATQVVENDVYFQQTLRRRMFFATFKKVFQQHVQKPPTLFQAITPTQDAPLDIKLILNRLLDQFYIRNQQPYLEYLQKKRDQEKAQRDARRKRTVFVKGVSAVDGSVQADGTEEDDDQDIFTFYSNLALAADFVEEGVEDLFNRDSHVYPQHASPSYINKIKKSRTPPSPFPFNYFDPFDFEIGSFAPTIEWVKSKENIALVLSLSYILGTHRHKKQPCEELSSDDRLQATRAPDEITPIYVKFKVDPGVNENYLIVSFLQSFAPSFSIHALEVDQPHTATKDEQSDKEKAKGEKTTTIQYYSPVFTPVAVANTAQCNDDRSKAEEAPNEMNSAAAAAATDVETPQETAQLPNDTDSTATATNPADNACDVVDEISSDADNDDKSGVENTNSATDNAQTEENEAAVATTIENESGEDKANGNVSQSTDQATITSEETIDAVKDSSATPQETKTETIDAVADADQVNRSPSNAVQTGASGDQSNKDQHIPDDHPFDILHSIQKGTKVRSITLQLNYLPLYFTFLLANLPHHLWSAAYAPNTSK